MSDMITFDMSKDLRLQHYTEAVSCTDVAPCTDAAPCTPKVELSVSLRGSGGVDQQIPTEQPWLPYSQIAALFPPQPFLSVFWSNTSQAAAASDQPPQRPVGRMPLEAGVSRQGHNSSKRIPWDCKKSVRQIGISRPTQSWVERRGHQSGRQKTDI
eukprot:superscaffoldBa00000733_g6870